LAGRDSPEIHLGIGQVAGPVGQVECGRLDPAATEGLVIQRLEELIIVQLAIGTLEALEVDKSRVISITNWYLTYYFSSVTFQNLNLYFS